VLVAWNKKVKFEGHFQETEREREELYFKTLQYTVLGFVYLFVLFNSRTEFAFDELFYFTHIPDPSKHTGRKGPEPRTYGDLMVQGGSGWYCCAWYISTYQLVASFFPFPFLPSLCHAPFYILSSKDSYGYIGQLIVQAARLQERSSEQKLFWL
jgi:hypothetical protein